MNSQNPTTHITPLRIYLSVGVGLLLLTGFTVWVATLNFGPWNMVIAMTIAVFKGTLVALFFMHLFYDSKLYSVIFFSALLFLAVFIILIMFDTQGRGRIYQESENPIRSYAEIYDESGKLQVSVDHSAERREAFEAENGVGPITELMAIDPLDIALADEGNALFTNMCGSCHKLSSPHVASPIMDVTIERSPEFVMNTILNHEEMAKKIAAEKNLPAENMTSESIQNITQAEARALLEYLRSVAPETDAVDAEEEEWIVE